MYIVIICVLYVFVYQDTAMRSWGSLYIFLTLTGSTLVLTLFEHQHSNMIEIETLSLEKQERQTGQGVLWGVEEEIQVLLHCTTQSAQRHSCSGVWGPGSFPAGRRHTDGCRVELRPSTSAPALLLGLRPTSWEEGRLQHIRTHLSSLKRRYLVNLHWRLSLNETATWLISLTHSWLWHNMKIAPNHPPHISISSVALLYFWFG